jgi:hypothetical protein
MQKRSRMPRDFNQLAKMVGDIATGQAPVEPDANAGKNPAAVALGKLGGVKGGKARAANMTKKQRSESAKKAANVRWGR